MVSVFLALGLLVGCQGGGGSSGAKGPAIKSVTPSLGPVAGGTEVVISAIGFEVPFSQSAPTVVFGGQPGTGLSVLNDNRVSVFTPPAALPAMVDVVLTSGDGLETATWSGQYVYSDVPRVRSVQPAQGDPLGGESVTILGDNFISTGGSVIVTFGTVDATGVIVIDRTTITCVTPAHPAGAVAVWVTNPGGEQGYLLNGYRYLGVAPEVTSVTPDTGDAAGGEPVTLRGDNFDLGGPVTVTFGGIGATGINVVSQTTINCNTPPHPAGAVTVQVTNPGGEQGSLTFGYIYTAVDPAVLAMEDRVFDLVNQERTAVGRADLIESTPLREVARAHSEDMRDRSFFDHVNPDGHGPADRVTAKGLGWSYVSENILWNQGAGDPAVDAVAGWMNSPPHKKNMLDEDGHGFTATGVGCATDGAGKWWFTQVFVRW